MNMNPDEFFVYLKKKFNENRDYLRNRMKLDEHTFSQYHTCKQALINKKYEVNGYLPKPETMVRIAKYMELGDFEVKIVPSNTGGF